jgi:hypothetical protein
LSRSRFTRSASFATPLLAAAIVAALFSVGNADSPGGRCAGDPRRADLANGEGTIAVLNRDVVVVGEADSRCAHQRSVAGSGLVRHVAAQVGTGTAYVKDAAGDDSLVVMTPDGTDVIDGGGEVTQPSWSPEGDLIWSLDMSSLSVMDARTQAVSRIPAPAAAIGVFSPRFEGTEQIVAVGQEAVSGAPSEDDALNNLFEYDLAAGRWNRVTDFTATAEEWSAIRTPQVMPDGSVLFVRVSGNVHETVTPRFELWRAADGTAARLRTLPGEMYLAGLSGDSLLWNISTATCGDWELFVESGSDLESVGCGAVAVDPVNLVDPDLVAEDESPAEETSAPVAVAVGDFATRRAAKVFAAQIGGRSEVFGHTDAPSIVKPGAFALVRRVPVGGNAEAALAALEAEVDGAKETFIAPYPTKP